MFSCILVGEDTKHYCEARIKGSAADVATALKKYIHATAWKLSKVGLDGYQQLEYLSIMASAPTPTNLKSVLADFAHQAFFALLAAGSLLVYQ